MKFLLLFSLAAIIGFYSCSKDEDTVLPADEAKAEVTNAVNDMKGTVQDVMNAQAMQAGIFMMSLEPDFGKSLVSHYAFVNPKDLVMFMSNPSKNKLFKPSYYAKHDIFPTGTYEYNFTTNVFDQTDQHDLLVIYFPSDQAAFDANTNDAELAITTFSYQTYNLYDSWDQTYYEVEVPTRLVAYIKVDNVSVFTVDYTASFQLSTNNEEIVPKSLAVTVTVNPYTFTMNYSGNNEEYTTSMSFSQGNDVIAEYNVTVKLTSDLWDEAPEKISGHIQFTPLKLKGFINMFAVEQAANQTPANVALMNENISVTLIHVDINRTLGSVEARAFVTDWGESIEPVLVYDDGTWQKLETIFQPLVNEFDDLFSK